MLFWISPTPMARIEDTLTQHGGALDGAAGPVRSVASRTCDLLPGVARVATFVHPGLELSDRVSRLLIRLELGVPAGAATLAGRVGQRLTRSDYLGLLAAHLSDVQAVETASDVAILACVGGDSGKLAAIREAATALRTEQERPPAAILPPYEQ
jgi:helicase